MAKKNFVNDLVLSALDDDFDPADDIDVAVDEDENEDVYGYERLDWGPRVLAQPNVHELRSGLADAFARYAKRRLAKNSKLRLSDALRGWQSTRKTANNGVIDATNIDPTKASDELLELCRERWNKLTSAS